MTSPTSMDAAEPSLDAIIHDLRGLHQRATPGEWSKGQSTHHTVSRRPGQEPYRIAEFHHADDALFCDVAHEFVPRLLDEIERLRAATSPQAAPVVPRFDPSMIGDENGHYDRAPDAVQAAPARPQAGDAVPTAHHLAGLVLRLNELWNEQASTPRIADQLGMCRVIAEHIASEPELPTEQQLIDGAPSPLKKLGQRLGELLDEDQFAHCEALLLEGLLAVQQGRDVQGDIDHYNGNN